MSTFVHESPPSRHNTTLHLINTTLHHRLVLHRTAPEVDVHILVIIRDELPMTRDAVVHGEHRRRLMAAKYAWENGEYEKTHLSVAVSRRVFVLCVCAGYGVLPIEGLADGTPSECRRGLHRP